MEPKPPDDTEDLRRYRAAIPRDLRDLPGILNVRCETAEEMEKELVANHEMPPAIIAEHAALHKKALQLTPNDLEEYIARLCEFYPPGVNDGILLLGKPKKPQEVLATVLYIQNMGKHSRTAFDALYLPYPGNQIMVNQAMASRHVRRSIFILRNVLELSKENATAKEKAVANAARATAEVAGLRARISELETELAQTRAAVSYTEIAAKAAMTVAEQRGRAWASDVAQEVAMFLHQPGVASAIQRAITARAKDLS